MSALWLDVEVLADRHADIKALFAELNEEDETLPPIIVDRPPHNDYENEAA